MRLSMKTAQLRNFFYLQGLVAQQVFCFFQTGAEQIIFGSGGKKAAVIGVKLALFHIHTFTETFHVPVLSSICNNFKANILKYGIEVSGIFFLDGSFCESAGDGQEQKGYQGMNGLFLVGKR